MVENATAVIVDHDDQRIAPAGQGQAAKVMLAGQVAEQGNDTAMRLGDAHGHRDVAVDAAGATIAVEMNSVLPAAGITVELPDGQRITDEQGRVFGQFVNQHTDMAGIFICLADPFLFGEGGKPVIGGGADILPSNAWQNRLASVRSKSLIRLAGSLQRGHGST